MGKKEVYVTKVRALRYRLKIAKDRKEITNKEFWDIYKKIGGNTVRNVAHLRTLIDEIISKTKRLEIESIFIEIYNFSIFNLNSFISKHS